MGFKSLLLDLAKSVGLNKIEIETYLNTDEPFNAVQKSLKELRRYSINGVPTFIIGEKLIVGAQPYTIFKQAINELLNEKSKKS